MLSGQLDRRESIHSSVNADVADIFKKKTHSQLVALQKQINQKIASGDAVDIGKHDQRECNISFYGYHQTGFKEEFH